MQENINNRLNLFWALCIIMYAFTVSCTKIDNGEVSEAKLIFRYRFDSTQQRLNSMGVPSSLASGYAAQSPTVKRMGVHYVELSPDVNTPFGQGEVLFRGPETNTGGESAIDFDQASYFRNHEVFFAIPLQDIPPGEYEWLRIEPTGMDFSVNCHIDTTFTIINDTSQIVKVIDQDQAGILASFIGYDTYINTLTLNSQTLTVDSNRKQGFWAFETTISGEGFSEIYTSTGQSFPGGTTVVNPIHDSSPVPEGSGVITAAFAPGKLVITGNETENIIVEVALSTNQSFEWKEIIANGKWDPWKSEPVVDMGIRGMIPLIH